jgi:beta-xylosidase
MKKITRKLVAVTVLLLACTVANAADPPAAGSNNSFRPGEIWPDDRGQHINAHGGGILHHEGTYYWFGEHKADDTNSALVGVTCYSSTDLYRWKYEGVAFAVEQNDTTSSIRRGCVIERPKVIYNETTGKFVMYFHHELKGHGYAAAQTGVAVSDRVAGPYRFIRSVRPNAGRWPVNMTEEQKNSTLTPANIGPRGTPGFERAVIDGVYVRRDFKGGQMSRDMTLYVDDDGRAYHVYSSEENQTLHVAALTSDYLDYSGEYYRVAPAGWNEAPAIFKKDGKYFMITSGCTGWRPNAARLLSADKVTGPWTLHDNPCRGEERDVTFNGQSTFVLALPGERFIFMADRWKPRNPSDGRYIWLPVRFEGGLPFVEWQDEWTLDVFN